MQNDVKQDVALAEKRQNHYIRLRPAKSDSNLGEVSNLIGPNLIVGMKRSKQS